MPAAGSDTCRRACREQRAKLSALLLVFDERGACDAVRSQWRFVATCLLGCVQRLVGVGMIRR
jgi:hypothetical protein